MLTRAKMPLLDQLDKILEKRRARDLARSLTISSPTTADFSSNDWLGLSHNSILHELFLSELARFPHPPLGSTGSRLLGGNSSYVEELEAFVAQFHNAETALIFNSGYDANMGFFSCVPQKGDVIIIDEFIHASVHEGVRLSRAGTIKEFEHNNIQNLKSIIEDIVNNEKGGEKKNIFVAVESLYSMDGDVAPLKEIVEVLKPFNAYLMVDEAHATGVYGDQGKGIVCELGLEREIFARLHTFGKALATNGAVIFGPEILRMYLVNYARSFIYTTFLPFSNLIGIKCAYSVMSGKVGDQLRKRLKELIATFRTVKIPPHMLLPSTSHIQGIIIPGNENVVRLSRELQRAGHNVKPIRAPTVRSGKERVRICLHADNTLDQVKDLIRDIETWVKEYLKNLPKL